MIEFLVIVFFIGLQLFIWKYVKSNSAYRFPLAIIIDLFSIIIGIAYFTFIDSVLLVIFNLFFIFFQTIVAFVISLEYYQSKRDKLYDD